MSIPTSPFCRISHAEVDRFDNLDIGRHAMDGFEIVRLTYVFRRRLKGFDGTFRSNVHCTDCLVFQELRCAQQGFIDLVLGQLRHVLVNTDFQ